MAFPCYRALPARYGFKTSVTRGRAPVPLARPDSSRNESLCNLADVKLETVSNEYQLADLEQLQCSQIEHKRLSIYQPDHTTGIVFSILCPIFLIAAWLVPNQD